MFVKVCDSAKAVYPFFPGKHEDIHFNFLDPLGLTGKEALFRIPANPGQYHNVD